MPGWQPPADLCQFLENGPKPVYVGFGSMVDMQKRHVPGQVLEALRRTGRRVVWQGGSADIDRKLMRAN